MISISQPKTSLSHLLLFGLLLLPFSPQSAHAFLPGRTVLASKVAASLPARQRVTRTFVLDRDAFATIKITEANGRKISLRATNNGIQVFRDESKGTLRARLSLKKGKFTMHIINRHLLREKSILYSVTLWPSIDFFNKYRADIQLAKNEALVLPKRGRLAKTYNLSRGGALTVEAMESSGRKIGFEILSNGRVVFKSGARAGRVTGRAKVKSGVLSVHFINKHLWKEKRITFSIRLD
ncbi:MAG: hypothetical protein H6728_13115 [Myxococcales bacterium]|nr:hypothetical protein [Myxococcales bacterium]MCB9644009.1 hypothetical protein [Myxococcales bacterium]